MTSQPLKNKKPHCKNSEALGLKLCNVKLAPWSSLATAFTQIQPLTRCELGKF